MQSKRAEAVTTRVALRNVSRALVGGGDIGLKQPTRLERMDITSNFCCDLRTVTYRIGPKNITGMGSSVRIVRARTVVDNVHTVISVCLTGNPGTCDLIVSVICVKTIVGEILTTDAASLHLEAPRTGPQDGVVLYGKVRGMTFPFEGVRITVLER